MTDPNELLNLGGGEHVSAIGDLLRWVPAVWQNIGARNAGVAALLEQHSLEAYRPTLIDLAAANEAWRRGAITDEQWTRLQRRAGYSETALGALRANRIVLPDVGSIGELSRRGLIDEGDYARRMSLLGYNEGDRELLGALRFYIPSAQDVISFANRDVYYPDVVSTYQMDADFPDAMLPDMQRAGLTKDTALKFWEAHWSLPSMPLAFEMYQRNAETGLTHADMNRLMRSAGIEPYWRDKILAVSFSPFTRVDIRRMHKAGILDRDRVVRAYRDIGYDADRAELLAQFTEKLNGTANNDELAPFRTKFRTHAETLYEGALIEADELRSQLIALGYSPGEADAYVQEAEFVRTANSRKAIRAAIRTAYEGGHIDSDEVARRLAGIGDSDATRSRLIAEWGIVRELHAESAHTAAARALTKTEITAAYEDSIIDKATATQHLHDLRYSDADAELELALADARAAKGDRTKAETVQHALYIARRTDNAGASKGLTEAGVSPERIQKLLPEWAAELAARTPGLTKAEIAHAVVHELLDSAEGYARLVAMGYGHADSEIIIALANKGVVIA